MRWRVIVRSLTLPDWRHQSAGRQGDFRSSATRLDQRIGAAIRCELMKSIHQEWQSQLSVTRSSPSNPLPDKVCRPRQGGCSLRTLRRSHSGQHSADVRLGLSLVASRRAAQQAYQKVLKEVEQWIINGPGAPPRGDGANRCRTGNESSHLSAGKSQSTRCRGSASILVGVVGQPNRSRMEVVRLDLAMAIVDPANPLTSRVFVNRLWQRHFGAGLVRTPSDFGMRSDPPGHIPNS